VAEVHFKGQVVGVLMYQALIVLDEMQPQKEQSLIEEVRRESGY
jgi:hypothetical protein